MRRKTKIKVGGNGSEGGGRRTATQTDTICRLGSAGALFLSLALLPWRLSIFNLLLFSCQTIEIDSEARVPTASVAAVELQRRFSRSCTTCCWPIVYSSGRQVWWMWQGTILLLSTMSGHDFPLRWKTREGLSLRRIRFDKYLPNLPFFYSQVWQWLMANHATQTNFCRVISYQSCLPEGWE